MKKGFYLHKLKIFTQLQFLYKSFIVLWTMSFSVLSTTILYLTTLYPPFLFGLFQQKTL